MQTFLCAICTILFVTVYCIQTDAQPFLIGNIFKHVVHNIPIPDIERKTKISWGTVSFSLTNIQLKEFDLLLRPNSESTGYPINLTLRTRASLDWKYDIDMILKTSDEGHLNLKEILIDFDLAARIEMRPYPQVVIEPTSVKMHNVDMLIESKGMSSTTKVVLNKVVDVLSKALRTQIENTLKSQVSAACAKLSGVLDLVLVVVIVLVVLVPLSTALIRNRKQKQE
jgi:hypothetical protein